ncbi:hypothetical protein SCMC78_03390 [Streptomyces sp. CMC78]|uniref:Uncharacterized protein n=1 Tax=Streptomyces sp. CMC78 TaxID=3231512 RepID=A0AB33K4H4_9ACTN
MDRLRRFNPKRPLDLRTLQSDPMRQTAASAGKYRRPGARAANHPSPAAPETDARRPVDHSWITRRTQFRIPLDLKKLGQANLTS